MTPRLIARLLATWAIESCAFFVLAHLLPRVRLDRWQNALAVVLLIGLLNATLRPAILLVALNFGVALFALTALLLNVVVLFAAAALVPGVHIAGIGAGTALAFALTGVNAAFTAALSIDDDDAYYRNVVKRAARRATTHGDISTPGTVIIQIDGLAEPILREALADGRMPALQSWLDRGSHRLVAWNCGVPSMTPASQAGILHGNNANIPAFRWYEKDAQRLIVANHPVDARWLDGRQTTGHGLLRDGGASNSNILTGEAAHVALTQAGLVDERGRLRIRTDDFYGYLINPYNLYRTFVGMVGEVLLEWAQAWWARLSRVQPRMRRGGVYPLVRACCTVLLSNLSEYLIVDDMYRGRSVSYTDFLGYDEVAHHSGPRSGDAIGQLPRLDRVLRALDRAAAKTPRRYRLVVLSDHGQSWGATFRQRHGYTLAQLVDRLIQSGEPALLAAGKGEGVGALNAALAQAAGASGRAGRSARRLLGAEDGSIVLGRDEAQRRASARANTIVCASGNLAQIYFADRPGRLTLEAITAAFPALIDGLRRHPSIGFLLVLSADRGPLVLGPAGERQLCNDSITGADPLAPFEPDTAASLRRLSGFSNVGDLVVNSSYDPHTGEVAAFEELIGCHGGAGGLQTRPFLLFPSDWATTDPAIGSAEALHEFLSTHLGQSRPGGKTDTVPV